MFVAYLSMVNTSLIKAQCVDSIESNVDCCTKIDVYADCGSGPFKIGTVYDDTSTSICGIGCVATLGTTTGPKTKLIALCSPNLYGSVSSYCASNPGCSISFVFVSISGCSINPPNGITVTNANGIQTWSSGCCCDQPFSAQITGGKLKYWYDCP